MRMTMTKEVTKTSVQVAKMVKGENGLPVAEVLPVEILMGNVTLEKAQKEVGKKYDYPVVVFGVQADTEVYVMAVEDFIKTARRKVDIDLEEAQIADAEAQEALKQANEHLEKCKVEYQAAKESVKVAEPENAEAAKAAVADTKKAHDEAKTPIEALAKKADETAKALAEATEKAKV